MFRYSRLTMVCRMLLLLLLVVGLSGQIPIRIPMPKVFSNPFEKGDIITTGLNDAITEVPFLDDFDPQDMAPLSLFPRRENGEFNVQKPGAYEFLSQSYCLHAGTHGPGKGNGYLYAPLKGPGAEIIRNVLQRSVAHPEIQQHQVQLLVWAILAKTKPSQMNSEMRNTARALLKRDEMARLEGFAFDDVSQDVFNRALGRLPPEAQSVMNAERQIRDAVTTGNLPFDQVERIAVLTGEPLPMKGDRNVPLGRWSFQPDGYFIRYFPDGYDTTRIEVYFPENFSIGRDPSGRIISIATQDGKRLDIEYDDSVARLAVNREPSLTGSAFRSVKLRYTFGKNPKIRTELGTAEMGGWNNSGWTFSGNVNGKGSVASAAARYGNAGMRYDAARRNADDLRKMSDNLTRLPKGTNVAAIQAAGMDGLLSLMQLAAALNDMLSVAGADRAQQFFDPVEFVKRAWASEFSRNTGVLPIAVSVDATPSVFVNISYSPFESITRLDEGKGFGFSGGAASPGDQGRQRLATSDKPKDPDNDCKASFSSCQDSAGMSNVACNLDCTSVEGALAKLNCFRACSNSYAKDNYQCSTQSKKCLRGGR